MLLKRVVEYKFDDRLALWELPDSYELGNWPNILAAPDVLADLCNVRGPSVLVMQDDNL